MNAARIVAVVSLALAGWGGVNCSANPVALGERLGTATQGLVDYYQNNNACGQSCGSAYARTCGNMCVPPVADGDPCSQTDCTWSSVCANPASSCTWISGTTYQCQPAPWGGETILAPCDLDPNGCAHDLFCKDFDGCNGTSGWGNRCAIGVDQGYPCDSDWVDPGCAPCMPGSTCVDMVGGWGTCMVTGCSDDADCPCEDGGSGVTGGATCDPASGRCRPCHHEGESCSDNVLCCDANTHCGSYSVCCKDPGQACEYDSDCCEGDDICRSDGTCGACTANSLGCAESADCCSGSCRGGTCRPNCAAQDGDPCVADNVDGECKKGTYSCDQTGLHCNAASPALDDPCDGRDNDCDGEVDEDADTGVCSSPFLDYACQTGFAVSINGHLTCAAGVPKCRANALEDFCTICGGSLAIGGSCGACPGHACDASHPCDPSVRCINGYCEEQAHCAPPTCWVPYDAGSCQ